MAGYAQTQFQNTIDILTITQKQRHSKTVLHNQRDHRKESETRRNVLNHSGRFFICPAPQNSGRSGKILNICGNPLSLHGNDTTPPQHSKASYVLGKRYPPLLSAAAQRAETGLRSGCHRENLSTGMGRHLPHGGRSGSMRGDRRRHGASARRAAAAAGHSAPLGLDGRGAGETLPPPAEKGREDGGSLRRKRHPHARTEGAGAEQGLPRSGAS